MSDKPKPFNVPSLPRTVTSEVLMSRQQSGESSVIVLMQGSSSVAPFLFAGRSTKQYRFVWNKQRLQHALKCPVSVWNGGVGRDLLDQMRLSYPLVPEFVMGVAEDSTLADSVQGEPATGTVEPLKTKPEVDLSEDPTAEESSVEEEQAEDTEQPVELTAAIVREYVEEQPARVRHSTIAQHFTEKLKRPVSIDDIKAIIAQEDSGLEMLPAGWVGKL